MKFRRHMPQAIDWTGWARPIAEWIRRPHQLAHRRRLVVWLAGFAAAFIAGYIIAALFLFPAPIFASTKIVPRILGIDQQVAREKLTQAGLDLGEVETVTHPSAPRGHVVWQDPPPGTAVPGGTPVQFSVSNGPQRVPVPDLSGYDVALGKRLVVAAGLRIGRVEVAQAPVPRDVVVNTRPPAGTALTPGSAITLVVSVGAPTITVPELSGLSPEEATVALELVGLALGTSIWRTSNTGEPGTIMAQDPAPGTLSAPGTVVNVSLVRRR